MNEVLKFLGNGSCFNTELGNTSAFIRDKNYLLLIDCGEDTFSKIREYNLCSSVLYVDILITHMHSDHIGSLSSLIYYLKYCYNIVPNIYFHENKLINFLDLLGHTKDDFNFKKIDYNKTYTLSNPENEITIDTKKINHLSHISSIGYVITYKNNKLIYTGDSKELFPSVFELINQYKDTFNVFIYQDTSFFETPAHMNIKKLIELVPNSYKKFFYCIHLEVLDDIDCETIIINKGFNIPKIYKPLSTILNQKTKFLLTEKYLLKLPCTLDSEDLIELISQINILEYDSKLKQFKVYTKDEEDDFVCYDLYEVLCYIENKEWYILE